MSTAITKNVQVGSSGTATDNFTIFQPATPDGTLRIGNGNSGITTSLLALTSAGNLGIGTTNPLAKLHLQDNAAVYIQLTDSGDAASRIGQNGTALTFGVDASNGTTERMRLDSSGNLGLGVAPSAWEPGYQVLENSAGSFFGGSTATLRIIQGGYINSGYKYKYNSVAASLYEIDAGAHKWHTAPSGTAGNAISFTQALTLDASGNFLVGTTSASIGNTTGSRFITNGKTLQITSDDGSNPRLITNNVGFGDIAVSFRYTSAEQGSISITSTAVSFNTSSDYRLKNITGSITTSGAYIDSLNPVEGTWKADGSPFVGLIAHEVQEASRTPVATGTKDGEQMQGMDYSSAELIANLIAEVKSLRQRVAALEA